MSARVLIVEDEPLVALVIEEVLHDAGFEIAGSTGSLDEALALVEGAACDAAVLDVNLRGRSIEPVAEILQRRGTPFLFASGYGTPPLPERFADVPLLAKPFDPQKLIRAIKQILPERLISGG